MIPQAVFWPAAQACMFASVLMLCVICRSVCSSCVAKQSARYQEHSLVVVPSPSGPDGCKAQQPDQLHAALMSQHEISVQRRQLVKPAGGSRFPQSQIGQRFMMVDRCDPIGTSTLSTLIKSNARHESEYLRSLGVSEMLIPRITLECLDRQVTFCFLWLYCFLRISHSPLVSVVFIAHSFLETLTFLMF